MSHNKPCSRELTDPLLAEIWRYYAEAPTDEQLVGPILHMEDLGTDWVRGKDNYAWYWAVARAVKPFVIGEIGVRYGYSLYAMVKAFMWEHPAVLADVYGWDNECYAAGSLAIAKENLSPLAQAKLSKCDTRRIPANQGLFGKSRIKPIGLMSVDGDHTYEGTRHDLELAFHATKDGGYILLDDVGIYPDTVHRAAIEFVADYGLRAWQVPTYRGALLIEVMGGRVVLDYNQQ